MDCPSVCLILRSSQQDAAADAEGLLLRHGFIVDVGCAAMGAIEGIVVPEGFAIGFVLSVFFVDVIGGDGAVVQTVIGVCRITFPAEAPACRQACRQTPSMPR